jgi:hypothetical protein
MKTVNCDSCRYFYHDFYTAEAKCKKGRRLYYIKPKSDFSNANKFGHRRKCKWYKIY